MADVLLDNGEMAFSAQRSNGWTPGSALLEPAHRVGDWMRVDATVGTPANVGAAETGGGSGLVMGSFLIKAHGAAATLTGLELQASGTGDDAAAFAEVRLYVDANDNGTLEAGVDQPFGSIAPGYPTDDGTLAFTGTNVFAGGETKRLLIVAKLNGSAGPGETFNTTVTAIAATGGPHTGLPTATITGIVIIGAGGNGAGDDQDDDGGCASGTPGATTLAVAGLALWALARRRRLRHRRV